MHIASLTWLRSCVIDDGIRATPATATRPQLLRPSHPEPSVGWSRAQTFPREGETSDNAFSLRRVALSPYLSFAL